MQSMLAVVLIAAVCSTASAGIEIHTSCVAEVAREPAHVRTLSAELARVLAGVKSHTGYALDVSLVRVDVIETSGEVEVRVEARAFLSDRRRRLRWSSMTRSTARGSLDERTLLQREAIAGVAQQLAVQVRTRRR